MGKRTNYPRGNAMTFPVDLGRFEGDDPEDLKYLYPSEAGPLNELVMTVCDQLEYDGSMMYDRYPDKVTMRRLASSICSHQKSCGDGCRDDNMMRALVELMLCHEMSCRRQKRKHHKKRAEGCKRCRQAF